MNDKKSCASTSINWYPGHMAKTKRQIIEDLKLIDVVIELLDARIPISSQNPDIKNITREKKKIIVLNKADLAEENETNKWVQYFKNQANIAIPVDSNSGKGINIVIKEIKNIMSDEKKRLEEKGRMGKPIRVMILGIPNVGKSSFINRISKKTSAQVGNKPGVTKQKQWIRFAENIDLLDTPGVLWPKFESEEVALNLAYTGTIKNEILEETEIAYQLLKFLIQNQIEKISNRYSISVEELEDILKQTQIENPVYEIMQEIGRKRGAIISGGRVDDIKTANILLEDFRSGKLGKISLEKVN